MLLFENQVKGLETCVLEKQQQHEANTLGLYPLFGGEKKIDIKICLRSSWEAFYTQLHLSCGFRSLVHLAKKQSKVIGT